MNEDKEDLKKKVSVGVDATERKRKWQRRNKEEVAAGFSGHSFKSLSLTFCYHTGS